MINPLLSEFCRALTGIEQSTVDSADVFQKVHQRFINWMFNKHELGLTKTYSIVTDGPFDMGRFLFLQCTHLGMEFPHYGNCWVNIRKSFANYYKGTRYEVTCRYLYVQSAKYSRNDLIVAMEFGRDLILGLILYYSLLGVLNKLQELSL